MDYVKRNELEERQMLGRVTCAAFGQKDMAAYEAPVFAGWATFSPKYGKMKPHYHEDEIMYIVEAKNAFARFGKDKNSMDSIIELHSGDMIRAHSGEWHMFEFTSEDGFLTIVPFFGVPKCTTIE